MFGWEILLFLIALWYAAMSGAKKAYEKFGERRAQNKVRKAHQSQLVTEALESGVAPVSAYFAAKAGAKGAVTVTSWRAMWIAFKNGWHEGWGKGHDRGEELRDGTKTRETPSAGDGQTDLEGPNQAAFCEVHLAQTDAEYRRLSNEKLCVKEVSAETCPAGHQIPAFCGKQVSGEDTRLCEAHQPVAAADEKAHAPAHVQGTPTRIAEIDGPKRGDGQSSAADWGGEGNGPTLGTPNQAALCELHFKRSEAVFRELRVDERCVTEVGRTECPVGHEIPQYCGRPVTAPGALNCDQHQRKEKEMPIETSTGGEVLTKEQFEAEMNSIIKEESAELEDAAGDLKRAEEHVKRVEVMAASLATAEIDAATIAAVRKFIDTTASRLKDAQGRIQNAEMRKTTAEEALATLAKSRQNAFYAA